MNTIKKIIIALCLGFALQPYALLNAAEAVEESIEAAVSEEVDAGVNEALKSAEEADIYRPAESEGEGKQITDQINNRLQALIKDGADPATIKAVAQDTAESITKNIIRDASGETAEFQAALEKATEVESIDSAVLTSAKAKLPADQYKAFETKMSEIAQSRSSTLLEEKPLQPGQSAATAHAADNLSESDSNSLVDAQEGAVNGIIERGSINLKEIDPGNKVTQFVAKLTRVPQQRAVAGDLARSADGEVTARGAAIKTVKNGDITPAEDGSGRSNLRVRSYGTSKNPDGDYIKIDQEITDTTYNNGEFRVTLSDGSFKIVPRQGILASVKDPESVSFVKDSEGNIVWRFNQEDRLFKAPKVNEDGLVFKDYSASDYDYSFNDLKSEDDLIKADKVRTVLEAKYNALTKTLGKTKAAITTASKWTYGKLKGAATTIGHGLIQAVVFTVPNILEQARVQAAQIAEQWLALTSAQSFGNLRVQIPAFLIPRAAPTSGVFLYIQVPQNTPANKANNFDSSTLLSGMYYVSKSDQYTPWGLTYIPQVSMFVNLNTGFTFTADGSAISEQQEFIALMKDKNSSVTGNAGAGPVVTYLESSLGKGIGSEVVGATHMSSWRDWLPFGSVQTASTVASSNPALAFLFADVKDSSSGEVLPPAIFDLAITQFINDMDEGSGIGEGACNSYATSQQTFNKCMNSGINTVKVRQAMGLGSVVTLLTNLTKQSQTEIITSALVTALQELLCSQQDLVKAILAGAALAKDAKNMDTANARQQALLAKLNDLNQANINFSNLVSAQNLGSQGVSPEVFIHALGMYVYETTDTPIANFMNKNSPLAQALSKTTGSSKADVSTSILKDYVVFLDGATANILPLYNAEITDSGELKYVVNSDIAYMTSLVSGRTYQVGHGSSTVPVKGNSGSVTDIANTAWSLLFDPNNGVIAKMDSSSGGQTGAALARQITAMTAYASLLISNGPYMKSGYTVTKVPLLSDLDDTNEQINTQNLFSQTATLLTPAAASTIKTILPAGINSASVGAIKIDQQVSTAQKQAFAGQDGNGIMIYEVEGALGVDENNNPINDYVIALSLSSAGTYVIMPLSASAFPNENSGISALVSIITGKVFTIDYTEQPLSWLVQVPLRYATGNSAGQLVAASSGATQTSGGTGVATVALPIATAFMPTELNPYNYVPTNQADLNKMQTIRNAWTAAVSAYQASPTDANKANLKSVEVTLAAFNKQIATGAISIAPRQIHTTPVPGDLLYVSNYYWGYYAGYNICAGAASSSAGIQGATPPTMWSTDNVCPSNQPLMTTINGTATAISLFDALPINTVKMLAKTFGKWFNATLKTSPALDSFETGPFNFTNMGSNDLYIVAHLNDVKNGKYFYQAAPGFSSQDILVLGQLQNPGTVKPELSLTDFVPNSLGQSFTQLTNPVLIDFKNGYVFIPQTPNSTCSGSVLCNLAVSKIYDVPAVINQVLTNQGTTLDQLTTSNPVLADRLRQVMYQFETNLQTMLTQNYFAGKQLLLDPTSISSYIYAVTPAPSLAGVGNTTNDYVDQVADAYKNATDFWICYGTNGPVQQPVSSSTVYMVSLVTGNKYSASSASPIGNLNAGTLQNYSSALLATLKNVPSFLTDGHIETLANNYLATQVKQAFVQPPVDLSVPTSFFAGLKQVASTQFDNLYQNNGQYVLKISSSTFINDGTTITPSSAESINYFVFNQVGASSDTGEGYYYPSPEGTVTASAQSASNADMVEPLSTLQGFNLQSMRAHYGVTVNSDGSQTLVLPMTAQPLPMASDDTILRPGTSGSYMQYLGSLNPIGSSTEKDYYYQNTLAQNIVMRRVIKTPLSSFGQKATQATTGTITTDYYLDLVSGDEFNTDGTPRLKQAVVAYTNVTNSNGSNGPLNLTNPLFVWTQTDPTTGLDNAYALFQQFDMNGYTLYTPQTNGTSYDVQVGGSMVRYSYQLSSSGAVVGVSSTPITNNQAGLQAQLGTATSAGIDMKTVLQNSGGTIISINTTFVDTSQMYHMVSVPSVYTFVPASSGIPYIFTQVLPGVTTAQAAKVNATNNNAFQTDDQVETFIQGIPFVATLAGQASAAQGQTTTVGAPSALAGQSYYVCGLLSPQNGLLSVVSYYPGTGGTASSTSSSPSTQSCPSNSSSCVTPGRYYFYANQQDSQNANAWLAPQQGTTYTQNYTMLVPTQTPAASPQSTPATLYGGTFRYALETKTATTPSTTSVTTNPFAPTKWAQGALYLSLMPQQKNAALENVAVTSADSEIYNFMYSSVDRDNLVLYNNNVQVVTTMEGQTVLAGPIPSGLPGQMITANSAASNVGSVSYYSGGTLVAACSLYEVTGDEKIGSMIAPFNATAPTYSTVSSTSSSSSAGPAGGTPFVAPGSLIDIATGVVYVSVSGTYYPLDVPAPQGSVAFIKNMLSITGIDKTGKIIPAASDATL